MEDELKIDVDNEIETEEESSMEAEFVDAVSEDDFRNAGDMFSSMLGNKVRDAIEAEKISIASNMFKPSESEE